MSIRICFQLKKEECSNLTNLMYPTLSLKSIDFYKIFLPELSLAFEYQGELHYNTTVIFGSAGRRHTTDELKKKLATDLGITLIQIPFWWDKSLPSILATLQHHRPDIQLDGSYSGSRPISLEMPEKYQKPFKYRPNASESLDVNPIDPKRWYYLLLLTLNIIRLMMEKFDGVRVYWDGSRLHALGLKTSIEVPKSCLFPSTPFEGELW
jgi:hypothetical protein